MSQHAIERMRPVERDLSLGLQAHDARCPHPLPRSPRRGSALSPPSRSRAGIFRPRVHLSPAQNRHRRHRRDASEDPHACRRRFIWLDLYRRARVLQCLGQGKDGGWPGRRLEAADGFWVISQIHMDGVPASASATRRSTPGRALPSQRAARCDKEEQPGRSWLRSIVVGSFRLSFHRRLKRRWRWRRRGLKLRLLAYGEEQR